MRNLTNNAEQNIKGIDDIKLKTCRGPYSDSDVSIHVNESLTSHQKIPLHHQNTHQLLIEVLRGRMTTYGQVLDSTAILCHHREQAT
jgi:hypothetical protein